MLRFSSSVSRYFHKQHLLRLIHARSRNRCYPDEEDDKGRKREVDRDDYFQLYKSKGQHLLTNQRILDSIVRKSDIKPTDTVLEIGPGTGNLTLKLLEAANRVIAFEIDKRMVEVLHKRVAERGAEDRLTVVCKDALKAEFLEFDLVVANIPYGISSPLVAKLVYGERRLTVVCKDALKAEFLEFDLVVANIPYGISSPLVAKLVYGERRFRSATLLLQKEFARRLLAKPGESEFNRLAVNVSLVADVEFVMDVSKREFVPCPKVDSSVVIIRPKAEVPDVNLDEWCAFTKACFGKKNKTLGATFKQKKKVVELLGLSELTGSNAPSENYIDSNDIDDEEESDEQEMGVASSFKEKLMGVVKSADFENKRPSKLSNDELLHLLTLFNQAGIYFHDRSKSRSVVIESFD